MRIQKGHLDAREGNHVAGMEPSSGGMFPMCFRFSILGRALGKKQDTEGSYSLPWGMEAGRGMTLKINEALLNYSQIICIASKSSFELFVKSEGPFQSVFTTQRELEGEAAWASLLLEGCM